MIMDELIYIIINMEGAFNFVHRPNSYCYDVECEFCLLFVSKSRQNF